MCTIDFPGYLQTISQCCSVTVGIDLRDCGHLLLASESIWAIVGALGISPQWMWVLRTGLSVQLATAGDRGSTWCTCPATFGALKYAPGNT